jgi:hypothetical protein
VHAAIDSTFNPDDVSAGLLANGTARIRLGGVTVFLHTTADCDALIAAFAEAKRLLDPPAEPAEPAVHVCECGHYEAYHAGAVRGDKTLGRCTVCADCDAYEAKPVTA